MKFGGTKEIREIIEMDGGCRIGMVVIEEKNYGYAIYEYGDKVFTTKKLNTALDWLVDNLNIEETRFRLTCKQKDILRQRMWEFIGTTIMGGIIMAISVGLVLAWLLGM